MTPAPPRRTIAAGVPREEVWLARNWGDMEQASDGDAGGVRGIAAELEVGLKPCV